MIAFIQALSFKVWLGLLAGALCLLPVAYLKGRGDMAEKRTAQVAKANAAKAEAILQAERLANQNDALRKAAAIRNQTERSEAIKEAVRAYPEETARPVGPATRAVTDRLRSQAGSTGTPSS